MKNALPKIAFSYLAGLILGYFFLYSLNALLGFIIVSSVLTALLVRRRGSAQVSIFLYALPLICGAVWIYPHLYPAFPPHHTVRHARQQAMLPADMEATIIRPVERRVDYSVLHLKALALKRNQGMTRAEGLLRVTLPGAHPQLRYGDRVLLKNVRLRLPTGFWNPGGFNYQAFMARRGIYAVASLWKDGRIKVLSRRKNRGPLSLLYAFKERSAWAIDDNLPPREGGILKAMLLGETWDVNQEDRRSFAASGTAHLLAISGLHVGFVALASYYIILLMLKGVMLLTITLRGAAFHARRWAALSSVLPVTAYAVMVGDRPSAIRAVIMVNTYMVARFLGRDRDLYNALALAGLIILIWKPLSILETGFQLSFLAAFFIVHYLQRARIDFAGGDRPHKITDPAAWKDRIMAYVLISVMATLATAPLIARFFNQVSLNSPGMNLMAIPVATALIPAGLLATALNIISETAARPFFFFSSLLTYILRENSSLIAGLSPLSFKVLTPWMPAAAAYYLLLTGTVSRWRKRRFILLLTGTAAALALSFSAPYIMPRAGGTLSVTFLDVGEGDAAVVRFPKGKVMVVDAGPAFRSGRDVGELVLTPFLRSRGIRRIDYLLVSHAQNDHAGGLRSLLREYSVGRLWDNGSDIARYFPRQWEDLPAPPPPEHLYAGKHPSPFYIDGVRLDILNPTAGYMEDNKRRSENARSLVIRLTYGDFSILFTGDIERNVQKTLISKSGALEATVIKVPHHGASDAVYAPFIAAVNPEAAVISAGRYNPFGHPTPSALSAYSDKGTAIYRTDRDGAVSIATDGHRYSVETFAESMRPYDIRKILISR